MDIIQIINWLVFCAVYARNKILWWQSHHTYQFHHYFISYDNSAIGIDEMEEKLAFHYFVMHFVFLTLSVKCPRFSYFNTKANFCMPLYNTTLIMIKIFICKLLFPHRNVSFNCLMDFWSILTLELHRFFNFKFSNGKL